MAQLKLAAIGLGFDGAETSCRIIHILGTLLKINGCFVFVVCEKGFLASVQFKFVFEKKI